MKQIDVILHAKWVIPLDDALLQQGRHFLESHSIAIHEDTILDILPSDKARNTYQARTEVNYETHALIPGLINAHTHAAMSLFRGFADDLSLMDWLQNHIWPAESKWVSEKFVKLGTELAISEMIRSGTTCFNDMYFFPDVTARVAAKANIRSIVGMIVLDFPTVWAADANEYIEKGLQLHDTYRTNDLVSTAFAPHAPYTVSDEPLKRIRTLSDELGTPVHIHVHETEHEVSESVKQTGKRPIERLFNLGLISPGLLAVHLTQVNDEEIELLSNNGSHVIHCPESNLKLASGFCPVTKLLAANVNVALGTDGAASNNDLDIMGEMRTAALIAKGITSDATALPAYEALKMATLNGARALGIDDKTGSLSKGKYADIIAVNLDTIETTPTYDPVSHLVYCCGREQVSDTWIAGRHVMKNRVITTIDTNQVKEEAMTFAKELSQ